MAKQFLPRDRQWTQRNDGTGTISASFNVDFNADRGSVRVSRPTRKIFDGNETFTGAGETFDGYAAAIVRSPLGTPNNTEDGFWLLADTLYYSGQTDSDLLLESNWISDGSGNTPSVNNESSDMVFFDNLLLVINNNGDTNGDIAAWDGSTWTDSWWKGTLGASPDDLIKFFRVGSQGDLFILTETAKVFRVNTSGTETVSGNGTLNFADTTYSFTCVETNSTRLFIGFEDTATGRGGVIEWDMSLNSPAANRIHKLGSAPQCIAVWNDLVIAVMSDGSFKYFNGSQFIDYEGVQLPRIDGVYDNFIHHNGWSIIDDMPHFLIKGTEFIEGRSNDYDKDTKTVSSFPSAVYCLDPQVGLYPRFALTNNTGTESHYSQPAVHNVGALYSLPTSYTKFLASYEVYTDTAGTNLPVLSYYDVQNSNDTRGWILFDSAERNQETKNVELLHRILKSGNEIKVYYQEFEEDEQIADGIWDNTLNFHTTDTLDVDDKWIGWVKTGDGAGQFLRVDTMNNSTSSVNVVTFKDANTFAELNDFATIQFMKFRYFGKADKTTIDSHTLTLPSAAKSRRIKILVELTQAAGTVNEFDYAILDT